MRKSLADLHAAGLSHLTNRWFTWERINGDGLCPTYLYRLVLARLPGGRRLYLHHFVGDDWSLDPHDHPKYFISIGLWGSYIEEVYDISSSRVIVREKRWIAPWIRKFSATHTHRIRAKETGGAWTLVYTGPVTRQWGFWHLDIRRWFPVAQFLRKYGADRKEC